MEEIMFNSGCVCKTIFAVMLFACSVALVGAPNETGTGTITGRLVDSETGDPLIGANVFFEGTMIGSASDLDGNYTIGKVPSGTYQLVISMIGYARKIVTDVQISV